MIRPVPSQVLPAIVFGGLPFYIGCAFWFLPNWMSKIFRGIGFPGSEVGDRLFSPKVMRVTGILWWAFGVMMWASILMG